MDIIKELLHSLYVFVYNMLVIIVGKLPEEVVLSLKKILLQPVIMLLANAKDFINVFYVQKIDVILGIH